MTKRMLLSVVAGAALATGIAARAAESATTPPASEAPGPGWQGAPYQGLNLTADQQKKMTDLQAATHRKMFAAREEMFRKASELRELWAAQNPDAKAIRAKQAELNQLRDQLATARTDHHLAELEILTPAQREKMEAWGGRGSGGVFGPCGDGHGPGMRGMGRGMDAAGPGMGGFGRGMGPRGNGFGGRSPGSCGMRGDC